MSKVRRISALLLCLLFTLTAIGISGCGGNQPAVTEAKGDNAAVTTEPAPAVQKPVTLTLWWGDSDMNKAVMLDAINKYRDIMPNVKIDAQWLADANDFKKLTVSIAGNAAPDIVRQDCVFVPALGYKKQFVDLSALGADELKSQFIESCWDANLYQGKAYALPFDANTIAFYYNKDLLDKAGVQPPKTYEEIITVADAIKKLNLPNVSAYTIPVNESASGWLAFQFCFWIWRNGGEILNEDWTKAIYNSPEGVDALQKIIDLRDKYQIVAKDAYLESDFYNGTVGLLDMGCWNVPTITSKDKKANFGITTMPVLKSGVPGHSGLGLYSVGILSSCKNQKEAYEFIKYFCANKQFQVDFSKKSNLMPSLIEAYNDDFYKLPEWQVFLEQLKIAKSRPGTPAWNEVADHMSVAIQEALTGKKTAQKALDDGVAKSNDALAKVSQ